MIDVEFPALRAAAMDSLIGRTTMAGRTRVEAAWRASSAIGRLRRAQTGFRSQTATDRLRTITQVLGVAAIGYWAALAVMPPYVATGVPRAWFLGLAVGAWWIAGNAAAVSRAWPTSLVSRGVRWLVS